MLMRLRHGLSMGPHRTIKHKIKLYVFLRRDVIYLWPLQGLMQANRDDTMFLPMCSRESKQEPSISMITISTKCPCEVGLYACFCPRFNWIGCALCVQLYVMFMLNNVNK